MQFAGLCFALLIWAFNGVHGQSITFSSFHERSGRSYGCPGEILLYVCNGTGDEIDIYAPPYILSTSRLSFTRADPEGSGVGSGSIGAFLLSSEDDYISVGVTVRDTDLGECDIICEVHSNAGSICASVVHRPSESPLEVTSPTITYLGSLREDIRSVVRVSWSANAGKYDLQHYTVTIYSSDNDEEIESVHIRSECDTVSVILSVPKNIDSKIYANITATSFCSITNNGVITPSVYASAASGPGVALSWYITLLLLTFIFIG